MQKHIFCNFPNNANFYVKHCVKENIFNEWNVCSMCNECTFQKIKIESLAEHQVN